MNTAPKKKARAQLANLNAELAFLGCILRASPEQRVQIAQAGREPWFSDAGHQIAWQALTDLVMRGNPVDLTLLEDGLLSRAVPPNTAQKITRALAEAIPTAGLWTPLAEKLQGYYLRREGVAACRLAQERFESLDLEPTQALGLAEAALFSLHLSGSTAKGMRHVRESLHDAYTSILEGINSPGHVTGGLPTGITDLDRINLKGLRPGHVVIVGAPPGKGKTVLLMKILWSIATGTGDYKEYERYHKPEPTGLFSLEMADHQLAERLLITLSRIILNKVQTGMMNKAEEQALANATQQIDRSLLHLEYCPAESIQTLRIKARYAVAKYNLKCIGFDYAQLITSLNPQVAGNRTQMMQEVSLGLKQIATECNVPIIVLAQPKQETWKKRAGLDAFGETSQLAKDAELAIHIGQWNWLESKYQNGGSEDDDDVPTDEADLCPDMYLDVVKNRNGPNTEDKEPIKLEWERHFYNFVSKNTRLFDSTGKENQHNN